MLSLKLFNREHKSVVCPNYEDGDGIGYGIDVLRGEEIYSFFLSFPPF